MNTYLMRRAIRAFQSYDCDKQTKRFYQRQWLEKVDMLGDKWLGKTRALTRVQPN